MKTNLRLARPAMPATDRLHDDPDYVRELALLQRLEGVQRRIRLKIERLEALPHVAPGDLAGKNGERRQFAARRLAAIEADLALAPTDATTLESKIEAALKIEAGEDLPEDVPPEERLARLRRQELALFVAVGEQSERVAALAGKLSYEHAEATCADHQAILREVYSAAVALARAADRERLFRIELLGRGYGWRPDVHPLPPLRALAILGREDDPASELSRWRRTLEDAGAL